MARSKAKLFIPHRCREIRLAARKIRIDHAVECGTDSRETYQPWGMHVGGASRLVHLPNWVGIAISYLQIGPLCNDNCVCVHLSLLDD